MFPDTGEWLPGFLRWKAGQTSTDDYYRQEQQARRRVDAAQEAGFTGRELLRLEAYRKAVAAGFFSDWSESA